MIEITDILNLFPQVLQMQVTQWTIAFSVAAWVHSGRVKKEIASQLSSIRFGVDGLVDALKADLEQKSKIDAELKEELGTLGIRVDRIEVKIGG